MRGRTLLSNCRRTALPRVVTVAITLAALLTAAAIALAPSGTSAATPSLGQLHSELGQSEARASSLSSSISSLNGVIASLGSQISLVQGREAAVSQALANDRVKLAKTQASLRAERALLAKLQRRLAVAKSILRAQLVSNYEGTQPDLVSVVLNANGFTNLLDQLNYLGMAEHRQQAIISFTRAARAQADQAARRLAELQMTDRQMTQGAEVQARALAGMNALLAGKQSAMRSARAAQQSALGAAQAHAAGLRHRISAVEAAQAAAAARAAAAAAAAAQRAAATAPTAPASTGPSSGSGSTVALGPSGGWAIPYAIVLCESGGQNLPPNSAGASGYYQILPATWKLFGGSGPAAYLAPKAEQDAVASRIWNGGAGASNWVCAGIVGIH
jgi:septal ring factor EnvC (AmiA/AmiB activator)